MSQTESQLVSPQRINFSNDSEDDARHCIPVYLRIKPSQETETSLKMIDDTTVKTNHAFRANKQASYSRVFDGSATQQEVFEGTTAGLIEKFLQGANVMTFAYGVTSSGKTHTIMGRPADPGMLARMLEMIFRSCKSKIDDTMPVYKPMKFEGVQEISDEDIDLLENFKATLISKVKGQRNFDQFAFENSFPDTPSETTREVGCQLSGTASCCVWISIYDIYNEVITDLLGASAESKTKASNIGQDSKGRNSVKDLIQLPVYSAAEAYSLLQLARQNLAVATQLVISDLAGSERQVKTGTSEVTLKQASAINNSLLVLGRCLEALRKKDKGMTVSGTENSQMKVDYNADVERWQDAVIGTTLHDGVPFIELRADHFDSMARDILRAEELLAAKEEEIDELKERLKQSEISRENLRLMQMAQLKEQRNKFVLRRDELRELHGKNRQALVEGFEEEIRHYKGKYSKYREDYAKLADCLNEKLWPGMNLHRERFGFLPEFPPEDGASEKETIPENTIKSRQDKLQEKDAEHPSLRADLNLKNERIESLQNEFNDQRKSLPVCESESRDSRKEDAAPASKVSEVEEQVARLRRELETKESFLDELSDLKETLREAEENRELLVAEHQMNTLIEELTRLKTKRAGSDAQTSIKSVTPSARVRSRVIDSSLRTPVRRRAPSLATGNSPRGIPTIITERSSENYRRKPSKTAFSHNILLV